MSVLMHCGWLLFVERLAESFDWTSGALTQRMGRDNLRNKKNGAIRNHGGKQYYEERDEWYTDALIEPSGIAVLSAKKTNRANRKETDKKTEKS